MTSTQILIAVGAVLVLALVAVAVVAAVLTLHPAAARADWMLSGLLGYVTGGFGRTH